MGSFKAASIFLAFELLEKDEEESFAYAQQLIGSSSDEEEEQTATTAGPTGSRNKKEEGDSDEESEKDDKNMILKYKSLLAELGEREKSKKSKGDMEITWMDNNEDKSVEDEAAKDLTPWEKYLKKKKDKKKVKKEKKKVGGGAESGGEEEAIPDDVDLNDPFFAEELGSSLKPTKDKKKKSKKIESDMTEPEPQPTGLELLVMDSDDERNHFNYKTLVAEETAEPKAKKKWKKKKKNKNQLSVTESFPKPDTFDVDVKDERFSALFSRPEFNIDPSEPNFKKTKAMEKLIGEKQKRIAENYAAGVRVEPSAGKKSRLDPEISSSLKAVKNKWKKNAKKYS